MEGVLRFPSESYCHTGYLAILLTASGPRYAQHHTGIVIREAMTESADLYHLRWHLQFAVENIPGEIKKYLLIAPNISRESAEQVAALCRKVWRANGANIPYAFSSPWGAFDPSTGVYPYGTGHLGLTCASFVLAVFHDSHVLLVDEKNWPAAAEDDAWRQAITDMMETAKPPYRASPEHISSVRADTPTVRFRPCQVAAAALSPRLPTVSTYQEIAPLVAEVEKALAELFQGTPVAN